MREKTLAKFGKSYLQNDDIGENIDSTAVAKLLASKYFVEVLLKCFEILKTIQQIS